MSVEQNKQTLSLPFILPTAQKMNLKLYPPDNLLGESGLLLIGDIIHFSVPEGKNIYLSTSENLSFVRVPEENLFSLEKKATYQLEGTVLSCGGEAMLWLIEYDSARRINHEAVILETGPFSLEWTTHPEHELLRIAIRLIGSGSLVLSDLRLTKVIQSSDTSEIKAAQSLTWLIKNPAINDRDREKRGDYHFGRGLSKYLQRLGQKVDTDYYPDWETEKQADVILVLRGWYPYVPKNKNALHIMWNISHPDNVPLEEYEQYDIVCVASLSYAESLRKKISRPVYTLLQCTDHELFNPRFAVNDEQRSDFIFVGNNYDVRKRKGVLWALDLCVPLKIWGRKWKKDVTEKNIVQEYVENDMLPVLYGRAKATLNEHWPDMLRYGFMNNRTLDALACGLPVICDYHEDFKKLFSKEVLYYRNKEELARCINRINFAYSRLKARVNAAVAKIHQEFSFQKRAEQLLGMVLQTKGSDHQN